MTATTTAGKHGEPIHYSHDFSKPCCGAKGSAMTNNLGILYRHPAACKACQKKVKSQSDADYAGEARSARHEG